MSLVQFSSLLFIILCLQLSSEGQTTEKERQVVVAEPNDADADRFCQVSKSPELRKFLKRDVT